MKISFGFIGKEEIEKAKEILIERYRIDKNLWLETSLWFEKPHRGNLVRGYEYEDVEEVLIEETEHTLETFRNMSDVESFHLELTDEKLEKFKKIFESGKIAYMIDDDIDEDKEYLCWSRIEDGQYKWSGTAKEAYDILNEWDGWDSTNSLYVELITVGVLQSF